MDNDNATRSAEGTPNPERSAGRRRLLKSGLGLAPVALTVVSQPVSATYVCKSASAFTSANASRPAVTPCNGKGKDHWKVNCSDTTRFDTVFTANTACPAGTTFKQVLTGTSTTSVAKLARNLACAHLNTVGGLIGSGVFTPTQLNQMWLGGCGSGFVPAPGAPAWNASGINTWLAQVFPAET